VRLEPVSRTFGFERGKPVDRWYIERFLAAHSPDVRGHVIEVAESTYTGWYGGGEVEHSDVLHAAPGNPEATIVGDLTTGEGIPAGAFDCFVMTQTLPFIYNVADAVRGAHRLLKPGGVVLATVPGMSQVSREDKREWGDWWRFTSQGARRLFADVFGDDAVEVAAHGNVLAACAFLYGLAADDLTEAQLAYHDPDYELLTTVRAVKRTNRQPDRRAGQPRDRSRTASRSPL
jgi:SAM-dependent methyltransferase